MDRLIYERELSDRSKINSESLKALIGGLIGLIVPEEIPTIPTVLGDNFLES